MVAGEWVRLEEGQEAPTRNGSRNAHDAAAAEPRAQEAEVVTADEQAVGRVLEAVQAREQTGRGADGRRQRAAALVGRFMPSMPTDRVAFPPLW